MLGERNEVIKDALEAVNVVMMIHGFDNVTEGSPTYNKLCGHIDREIAKLEPKRPAGRPKREIKREIIAI